MLTTSGGQVLAGDRLLGASGRAILRGNLGVGTEVKRVVAEITAGLGSVDILVNCAGGFPARKAMIDIEESEWNSVLASNLTSAFLCSKAVLPGMIQRRWGRIINISSE